MVLRRNDNEDDTRTGLDGFQHLRGRVSCCSRSARCYLLAWEKAVPQNPWYNQYLPTVSPARNFSRLRSLQKRLRQSLDSLSSNVTEVSPAKPPKSLQKALQPNARRCRERRACRLRCSDELWQTCIKMFPCLEQGQQRKTSRMESLMIADNELIDALVQGFLPLVKFQVRSLPCALRYAPVGFRCAACRLPLRCGVVLSAPVDSSSL